MLIRNLNNFSNWRNYGNEEYENVEDDTGVMGLDEEDPRNGT